MRKLFRILIALLLIMPASLAHANFEGSNNAYPSNGKRITSFPTGKYRLQAGEDYRDVYITKISGGKYRIEGPENRVRIAEIFTNSSKSFVLKIKEGSKYGYFIAVKEGRGLAVLDTSYAAHLMLNPNRKIPEALEKLPYSSARQNKDFLKKLFEQGDQGWFRVMFTIKPQ